MSRSLPFYAIIAAILLVIFEILLFCRINFVMNYFYMLAWWPYIFLADGIVRYKTGTSIWTRSKKSLLSLSIWSVTVWLIFELYNLVMKNWHYIDIVPNRWIRWLGYSLAFATVLPGLFETYELIGAFNIFSSARLPKFEITKNLEDILILIGISFLVFPISFPKYCYPLVWGGFVFLLDPINRRMRGRSFLSELSKGNLTKAYQMLLSGLICGFLWEFWNYWAGAKWIYTVPFVGNIKLFEMPVAGFLGFPPFALECYCMYEFLRLLGIALDWENNKTSPPFLWAKRIYNYGWLLSLSFQIPFWCYTFYLIDKFTVISFR